MAWCTTFDLDRFTAAAGGYLGSRAAENTLLLSAVQAARSAGHTPATAQEQAAGWLFGWWEPPGGGEPRGAFLHDPAAPLLISHLMPEMAASLAATLAKMGTPVVGVDAPTEAADAFAAAWSQRAGTTVRVHRHCHVYRLAGPGAVPGAPPQAASALPGAGAWPPQLPVPPGRLRVAAARDQPLLADWLAAFANERAERIGSPRDLAADLISYGGAVFWEVPQRTGRPWDTARFRPVPHHRDPVPYHRDAAQAREPAGQPAALATLTRPVAGTVRISLIYTPPEHRHSGYASAVTMAVGRAVLSGARSGGGAADEVVVVTDGNGSNLWATRLGYQLVSERAVLRFGPLTGPIPQLRRTGPMPRLPTGPLPWQPRLRH